MNKSNWFNRTIICINATVLGGLLTLTGVNAAELEEVVVTAQKRAENLQDVPLSISAFDAGALETQRIEGIAEVAQRVPNLSYSRFSSGRPEFTIRGIGTTTIARSGLENSVILFLDEVYISRSSASVFDLFDLEQISVLRGPQGTLFGKNVVGGAISITTSKPNTEEVEAKFLAGYGNYEATEFKGLVSGPLSDRVAGKISFLKKDNNGYGRDVVSGRRSDDDDSFALRGQLLFDVNEDVEILVSAIYSEYDNAGPTYSVTEADRFPASLTTGTVRQSEHGLDTSGDSDQWGISGNLNWKLGNGKLTAIAAYSDVDLHVIAPFGPRNIDSGGPNYEDRFTQDEQATQLTLELRYATELDGPINLVAGAFYSHEEVDRFESEEWVQLDGGVRNGNFQGWLGQAETDGWAVFADGTWEFNEIFTVRAGVRYTEDDKTNRNTATLIDDDVPGIPGSILFENFDVTAGAKFTSTTPRAVLEVRPFSDHELMGYFSWSEGFKSGGFDSKIGIAAEAGVPVNAETATNYEIGIKSRWFDNSLQFNAAFFHTDYKDLQINTLIFDGFNFQGLRVKNVGKATIEGMELEATWLPTDQLRLNASYGHYFEAKIDEFLAGVIGGFIEIRRDGNRLPNTPRHTFNINGTYTIPLQSGAEVAINADFARTHHFWYSSNNAPGAFPRDATYQRPTGVFNASASWSSAKGDWKITAWGKNLTDELYTYKRQSFSNAAWAHYAPPRTYGVSVQYNYN